MLKRLSTIAAALVVTTVSAVEAAPRTGTFEDHQRLWSAIRSTGTVVALNNAECFKPDGPAGYYAYDNRGNSEFVVCQDNAVSSAEVEWTANDLDTLRHEAVHLIQDCADGVRADGYLTPLGTSDEIMDLVDRSIGREQAQHIVRVYQNNGVTDAADLMSEVEAFSAAYSVSANTLSDMVMEACAVR